MERKENPTLADAWASIQRIEQAVFGDESLKHAGLVDDMEVVKNFMLKWDKREYAWKLLFAAVTSNVVMTILSVVLMLWLGGVG